MLKVAVLLLSTCVSLNAFAGFFSSKLTIYTCPQSTDVDSCSSICKADSPPMEAEFKVNKSEKAVQVILFNGGKQFASIYLEKCIIFDEKNWKCLPDQYSIGSKRMANGRFSDDVQIIGMVKGLAPMPAARMCGK